MQLDLIAASLIHPSADVMEASALRMQSAALRLEAISREMGTQKTADMRLKAELAAIRHATSLIGLLLRQGLDLQTGWLTAGDYTPVGDARMDWPPQRLIAEG